MSSVHTLSGLGRSSTSKPKAGTQIGSTVYHTSSAGAGLERALTKTGAKKTLGNIKSLSNISKKLSGAIFSGKDTEVDKQLTALARQKQRSDVPMTPAVRQAARQQREAIRPESKMTCPNGHKVSVPAAKKQLSTHDVYTCAEKGDDGKPCGALCGGADVHPLHLEVKYLNPQDKHKYLDSVRWLSKSEVDVQTREYIKGHPLVFPHLAEGVLFNDETDAWQGYILGWNIYYWFNDIQSYWERTRRELEERHGDLEESDEEDDNKPRGRGHRKKRKLASENKEKGGDDAEWEQVPDDSGASPAKKAKTDPTPAAAASSSAAANSEPIVIE